MKMVFRKRLRLYSGAKMIKVCRYAIKGGKRSNNFLQKKKRFGVMCLEFGVWGGGWLAITLWFLQLAFITISVFVLPAFVLLWGNIGDAPFGSRTSIIFFWTTKARTNTEDFSVQLCVHPASGVSICWIANKAYKSVTQEKFNSSTSAKDKKLSKRWKN